MIDVKSMTIKQYVSELNDRRDKLRQSVKDSPEPEYINQILHEFSRVETTFEYFGDEKKVMDVYAYGAERWLQDLLETADLFINNPDLSIHTILETVVRQKDPLNLKPFIEAYLKMQEKSEASDNEAV